MPWCPNCRNEYRIGITTCAECKIALVDSLDKLTDDLNLTEIGCIKEKQTAIRLIAYLRFSGIEHATIKVNIEARSYTILVKDSEKKEAMKHFKAFMAVEYERQSSATSGDTSINDSEESLEEVALISEEFNDLIDFQTEPSSEDSVEFEDLKYVEATNAKNCQKPSKSKLGIYDSYETAYKEHRSSAYLFLSFSVFVFIYILLNAFHVIQLINGVFSYSIISALCLGLIFLGLSSLKKVKELSGHLDGEQELTKKIKDFLNDFGGFSKLDEPDWSELSEDVIYFKRTARIRQLLTAEFGELEENYLDKVIEDYYDSQCEL